MTFKTLALLPALSRFDDVAIFAMRVLVGAFLIWGTADNVFSAERMAEFAAFMDGFGFPAPQLLAPLSVWAQFLCGALLCAGLLTRWAGLVMAFNFVVAFLMVHLADDFRAQFPALILIATSVYFATAGGGRLSLDHLLARSRA